MNLGNAGTAYVELVARLDKFEAGMARAKTTTTNTATAIERDLDKKVGQGFDKAGGAADRFNKVLAVAGSAFAAIGAARGVASIIQMADEYQQAGVRIGLATGNVENFAEAQQRVFEIAQRSSAPLGALNDLVARLGPSAQSSGRSTEELFRVTETLSKLLTVSGTKAAEADGAIRQLAQGFASGVLRGDEFNSVAEQMPALLDLVAKSTGKTRAELREMAADGQVSAQLLFDVLLNGSAEVDARFEKMGDSVGRSFQRIENSYTKLVSSFVASTGILDVIAERFDALSKALDNFSARSEEKKAAASGAAFAEVQREIIRLQGQVDEEIAAGRPQIADKIRQRIAQLRAELDAMRQSATAAGEALQQLDGGAAAGDISGGSGRDLISGGQGGDAIRPGVGAASAVAGGGFDVSSLMLSAEEPTDQPGFSRQIEEQLEAATRLTQEYTNAQDAFAQKQTELQELYKKGFIDIETYTRATHAAQQEAILQGAIELREYGAAWEGVRAALIEYTAAANDTAQVTFELTNMGLEGLERGLGGLGAMLVQGETSWEAFGDAGQKALADIVDQLIQLAVRQAVIAPLLNSFLGGGGAGISGGAGGNIVGGAGVGGDVLAAKGLAFDTGSLTRLGKGDVLRGPTKFRFAGGAAVAGELGTEGILPLKRTRSGNLGVEASGGGQKVELHIHNEHSNARVEQRQERGPNGELRIRAYIREAMGDEIGRGAMRKPMSKEFGLSPALARRG